MHIFWTILLGAIAAVWLFEAIDIGFGVPSLIALADAKPLDDAHCPSVSILFAARDEDEKLASALGGFLALDYPHYEVVAVDDRSEDATPQILADAAAKDSRLKPVRVDSLPAGWLGKPHGLEKAYECSTGEWLVFTDADVHFEPDLLRRAVALAERERLDHLTLLGRAEMFTVGEKIAMTFFGLAFLMATRPWQVSKATSRYYVGVGSFQMVRRNAYVAMGTHKKLAMEVVDDIKLGKVVKDAGFRSGVAKGGNAVSVHWHSGVANIVRGTTKNFYAATGFRLWVAFAQMFSLVALCVLPWVALPFVHGWARAFAAFSVLIPIIAQGGAALEFGVSPLYALTHPIGALIMAWMLANSTIVTLRQGGIVWRGTFYPIEELKKGVV